MAKDIQHKQEAMYDGPDLFYRTDRTDTSDGDVYNRKLLKTGFVGEGLSYGQEGHLPKDWEIYDPNK
jgi:hypothetical protein